MKRCAVSMAVFPLTTLTAVMFAQVAPHVRRAAFSSAKPQTTSATTAPERARVSRAALEGIERSVDSTIRSLDVNDPFDLLGSTRGVYLAGYGAVFTCELNLVITPISPFHTPLTPPQLAKLNQKKLARLALLKATIRQILVSSASALETVPPNEQIVLGVSLFYRSFENREGLPAQLVMQASRQALLDYRARRAAEDALVAVIRVEEL